MFNIRDVVIVLERLVLDRPDYDNDYWEGLYNSLPKHTDNESFVVEMGNNKIILHGDKFGDEVIYKLCELLDMTDHLRIRYFIDVSRKNLKIARMRCGIIDQTTEFNSEL